MPRLPEVSGRQVGALLVRLGYVLLRTRGSHAQYERITDEGRHVLTVPLHKSLAKGTLGDILKRVSQATGLTVDELVAGL